MLFVLEEKPKSKILLFYVLIKKNWSMRVRSFDICI